MLKENELMNNDTQTPKSTYRRRAIQTLLFTPALFFFTIALSLLIHDLRSFQQQKHRFSLQTDSTTASIREIHEALSMKSGNTFHAGTGEFITHSGEKIQYRVDYLDDRVKVGQTEKIYYEPANPSNNARGHLLPGFWDLFFSTVVLGGFGCLFLINGIVQMRKMDE